MQKILLVAIGMIIGLTGCSKVSNDEIILYKDNGCYIENYNDEEYYIIQNDYSGEYNLQYKNLFGYTDLDVNLFEVSTTMDYSDYVNYCNKWELEQKYTNSDWNYIVFSYAAKAGGTMVTARLAGIEYDNDNVVLFIWDDVYGVTADALAYVIIIPTEQKFTNIEIQPVYELQEYHNMIGKSPIEDANYDYEDNKIIAQTAYIYTNNEEVNNIFNKMLDSIVQKHSITVSDGEDTLQIMDFISSASIFEIYDNENGYTAYGETYGKTYTPFRGEYEFTYDVSREEMLYDIALRYEWLIVLGLSKEEKNPYNYESEPLVDTTNYTCNLSEDDKYYVITVDMPEESATDTYYINKNTYLIEKSDYVHGERKNLYNYTYSDYVVTIPEEVIKDSYEERSVDKPIIYLYPTEDTELTVKLGYEDKITCSYPKYEKSWNVLAQTSSNLIDLNTNKNLYALYYESENAYDFGIAEDGFIVKGKDSIEFLEEKLEILGLTEREAEEFIVYWLPKLEANKYNYIRFATMEEINQNMPLEFSTEPDTLIRVLMIYKGLDKPLLDIEEQQLEKPERTGFVAVEWGGTEIK